MSEKQLAVKPAPGRWPVWATPGHTAGGRVYWLCEILGEPGADRTPFGNPDGLGWEDDLDTPRGAEELVAALDSSWEIVDGCLDRWDEAMMGDLIVREFAGLNSSTPGRRSCNGCSVTTPITPGYSHRPLESMASPRSTCGVLPDLLGLTF